jgi:hypothetical protein
MFLVGHLPELEVVLLALSIFLLRNRGSVL